MSNGRLKSDRKSHRVTRKVEKELGLSILNPGNSETEEGPSPHLLLCNLGLTTHGSEESILSLCLPFGAVSNVVLLPQRSFSFVSFEHQSQAWQAFKAIHGQGDHPIYLAFVDKVPDLSHNPWTHRPWPRGLQILEDVITEEEEQNLLDSFTWNDSADLKNRQVQHFGYEFEYGTNSINGQRPIDPPLPQSWLDLLQRVNVGQSLPDQCTVNRYQPGQGIPAHIDTHSCCDGTICSLSLGSDTVMNFTHPDGIMVPVILSRRSFMVMSDESRYVWSHGIVPRSNDVIPSQTNGLTLKARQIRVSLTFRKVLAGECQCRFPAQCDSQRDQLIAMDDKLAKSLEDTHVHSVYENIASHFSETRHKPWPKVIEFLGSLHPGSILVDNGCGNGKYLGLRNDCFKVGSDYSQGLTDICRERGFESLRSDCLFLPFRSGSADGIICIAVIHHLSTWERRLKAVQEMSRVLRIGGSCLIYAWAQEQAKDHQPSSYLKKHSVCDPPHGVASTNPTMAVCDTHLPLVLPVHKNRTNFQHKDLLVPWKVKQQQQRRQQQPPQFEGSSTTSSDAIDGDDGGGETFHRFYHVFVEGELEKLVSHVAGVSVEKSYYDQGNWCVVFRRLS
ncbi:hypothetical protein TCAL_05060 [Tigriopus californicus]|uniref:tRNA (carboxymethyluridine(34)-5-O)-methyltransferase n=1 Tax=Tigriopus californicus TaxID=6832 RepID=A0A553P8P0_TIGCA|nr:alkylated DNA repair protein alkB homolog 8-like [Tigriopus californicus]TRY74054.1 hypothetical protein TCAL_05060 [Tigriopus californicus]|eukprot:TCALIF_05060-PA protein Name:"Similar to alkbh8 Alkylated DNA repair protein alkB homolog 8 (Xenopus tropicalis)" AED:0.07 eAED:0.07 QI:157/1/1/1/0.75/0.8/5/242/615